MRTTTIISIMIAATINRTTMTSIPNIRMTVTITHLRRSRALEYTSCLKAILIASMVVNPFLTRNRLVILLYTKNHYTMDTTNNRLSIFHLMVAELAPRHPRTVTGLTPPNTARAAAGVARAVAVGEVIICTRSRNTHADTRPPLTFLSSEATLIQVW